MTNVQRGFWGEAIAVSRGKCLMARCRVSPAMAENRKLKQCAGSSQESEGPERDSDFPSWNPPGWLLR